MGCETAAFNQKETQIIARNQDNQVGGFIKAQKPVRQNQERSTKNTHNRRAGFDSKRNQAGYTLVELIQVLSFVFLVGVVGSILVLAIKALIALASM